MSISPLSQALETNSFKNVCLVATDMDGTLTYQGKFTSSLLQALEKLAVINLQVMIVTGRSAGWVSSIVSYFPIVGAIAENGGLFYAQNQEEPELIVPLANLLEHRQQLAKMFARLQQAFPQIQESADNRFRITDWTFDNQNLTPADLQKMAALCQAHGWSFTYSTVQGHIKLPQQDKATGLLKILRDRFPQLTVEQILTVGDSPNDESLFDASKFPLSIGVANVLHYVERLTHRPVYVTTQLEGQGFAELADVLCQNHPIKLS